MQFMMAYFTQRQHIRKRVFAPLFSENDMVSLKANIFLPTLLTGVAVAHQTSDTHIFIEPRWVLVARSAQRGIVDPSNIHLNIFYHDR
jgi:hypothetical protein